MQARAIATFRIVTDVVILDEQMRFEDQEWGEFLDRMRVCYANVPGPRRMAQVKKDYKMLETLKLGHPTCKHDASTFQDKVLITPRNETRTAANETLARDYAHRHGLVLIQYECGEDKVKWGSRNWRSAGAVSPALATLLRRAHNKQCPVPKVFTFATGLPHQFTTNGAVPLGWANGIPGVTASLVLDAREEPYSGSGTWHLKYPPHYVIFKPTSPRHGTLPGLPEGTFAVKPEVPSTFEYYIPADLRTKGMPSKIRVKRQANFPLTLALAISDYTGQGCTFREGALLDMLPPGRGNFTDRNVYIMLSRLPSRARTAIMRLFPIEFLIKLARKGVDRDLAHDHARFERLARDTERRFHEAERAATSED